MPFQLLKLDSSQLNLICPYCQSTVIDSAAEQYIQPCTHTLFVAMDLSFEYVSDVFESSLPHSVDDIHANDDQLNIFQEISQSNYPEFIMYQMNLGIHDLSRYVGFSAQAIVEGE
jgi:hypothetical protein